MGRGIEKLKEFLKDRAEPGEEEKVRMKDRFAWYLLGLGAVLALSLGWFGFLWKWADELEKCPGPGMLAEALYRSLQLFDWHWELDSHEPVNCCLQIARFLAPAVALFAVLGAVAAFFRNEWDAFCARQMRDHVVIFGLGDEGLRLAQQARLQGKRVAAVEANEHGPHIRRCRDQGVRVVIADASRPQTLKRLKVWRAQRIYCLCGDAQNAAVAAGLRDCVGGVGAGRRPDILVHVSDLDLCVTLRAREFTSAKAGTVRLEFFNLEDSGARMLITTHRNLLPESCTAPSEASFAFVGRTQFAEALIRRLVLEWWGRPGAPDKLPVRLVDPEAGAWRESLLERYPYLAGTVDFACEHCDVPSAAFDRDPFAARHCTGAASAVFVCHPEEARALHAALAVQEHLDLTEARSTIYVRMMTSSGLAYLADSAADRIHPFALLDETCSDTLIHLTDTENLARLTHEQYYWDKAEQGGLHYHEPAMRRWEELDERFRQSSREQVLSIPAKLAKHHYAIGALKDLRTGKSRPFSDPEIRDMAEMEHKRWMKERKGQGYVYGKKRDDDASPRTHPDMVEFGQLTPDKQELDIQFIRRIPMLLARAGYQVISIRPTPPDSPKKSQTIRSGDCGSGGAPVRTQRQTAPKKEKPEQKGDK